MNPLLKATSGAQGLPPDHLPQLPPPLAQGLQPGHPPNCPTATPGSCSRNLVRTLQKLSESAQGLPPIYFANMILYFKENSNLKVRLTVDTFNNEISRVVERTNVTDENVDTILSSIDKIAPSGSTNIELALNSINNYVEQMTIQYPHHEIINIFMTDGEATCGSCDHETLTHIVNTNITNAFIGFGIDHDTALLNAISNWDKSNYYFIDKIENSGLVYGEILHGVVYKFLDNVTLSIKNGLIYDYKNN